MSLKKSLQSFFSPDYGKIALMIVLEFLLTFVFLASGEDIFWWSYLLSPSTLYLENTLDFVTASPAEVSFHGAASNVISLVYLYLLSSIIISLYKKVRGK
jgi:hypothetical protein